MPLLTDRHLVEGQDIRYTLGLRDVKNNFISLTSATEIRIYYRVLDRVTKAVLLDGFWDETDGVSIVGGRLRYIQEQAVAGFYSVFPHAKLPTVGYVNRSGDPVQFYVKKIHEI